MYLRPHLLVVLFSGLSLQSSQLYHVDRLKARHALAQTRDEDLSYCFSQTSICTEATNLFDGCGQFEDVGDETKWYQCICGNGWVTADTECDWCQEAYGLSFVNNEDLNTSMCSQFNGGTIAPLPPSVVAAVSAFNATYTGVISGGSGPSTSTTASNAGVSVSMTNSGLSSFPQSTQSATITKISDGGSSETSTPIPTSIDDAGGVETLSPSTTLKAGSGTGGAQGWNTGVAVMLSVVVCGVSVFSLLLL